MIRGQNEAGIWQKFEYDEAGRLVKIRDDSNNLLEEYTYGASRNRLVNETSAGRTYYAWGGSNVIAEYFETSTTPAWTKSCIYAGSRLLSTITKVGIREVTEFHHPDRLGTRLVTDPDADTYYEQATLPFGTALAAESSGFSNQTFTSYDRSAGTGLDYAINRTLSTGQSRFTQVDPIGMASASLGNPQSNNLFSYVQNLPVDLVDPTGLFAPEFHLPWIIICNILGTCNTSPRSGEDSPAGGGGGGGSPPPEPPRLSNDCPEQDFNVDGGNGYTGQELSAIAQTAVGEASNKFYVNEVEYSFATVINRQTINTTLHSALGNSRLNVFNGGTSILGLLSAPGQYQAYTENSGQKKVNQEKAKNNGSLPKGYVCDQLKAANNFARLIASGALSAADLLSSHPFTNNLGKNRKAPSNAFYIDSQTGAIHTGVYQVGDTIFFNVPYRF